MGVTYSRKPNKIKAYHYSGYMSNNVPAVHKNKS